MEHQTEATSLQLAYDRLQERAAFQAAFLGTASHELRAPINQIISLHQLILEGLCESPEEEREFLQQSYSAVHRVLQNLDLLISISKLDIGRLQPLLQPVPLGSLLAKVQQLLTMKALNVNCRLQIQAISPDLQVYTDADWLTQALMALLEAAIAARCPQVAIGAAAVDSAQVAIELAVEGLPPLWTAPPSPAEPDGNSESPSGRGVSPPSFQDLTPGFRYQLAERMLKHLRGTVEPISADDSGPTRLRLLVPQALPQP